MKYVLISIKDLTSAKRRLSELMTQEERTSLAWLMLEHVFNEAARAQGYDRIAVVTSYEPAAALARSFDFEVISETQQISESVSVDNTSRLLSLRGVSSVLSLPIDLPLITTQDIEAVGRLIEDRPSALIAPSRDGTGTNAIVRTPPDLFPSHFGPNSLAKHLAEALERGVPCELIHLPRIALDLDNPSDVMYFLEHGHDNRVYELLRDLQIDQRLARLQQ